MVGLISNMKNDRFTGHSPFCKSDNNVQQDLCRCFQKTVMGSLPFLVVHEHQLSFQGKTECLAYPTQWNAVISEIQKDEKKGTIVCMANPSMV